MDIPDLGDNAVQRGLIDDETCKGRNRITILIEASGDRHVFKPGTPSLIDMTFHLDFVHAYPIELGLVH